MIIEDEDGFDHRLDPDVDVVVESATVQHLERMSPPVVHKSH